MMYFMDLYTTLGKEEREHNMNTQMYLTVENSVDPNESIAITRRLIMH